MFRLLSIYGLTLAGLLFFRQASAQEQQLKKTPLKRNHIAYKYHIVDHEMVEANPSPKNGHSVQIGFNFNLPDSSFLSDAFLLTFVLDYTHLRKYENRNVFSAGLGGSLYPGKVIAKIRKRPYTPRMDKWLISVGWYKTLDKYNLNHIVHSGLAYKFSPGLGLDLFPSIGYSFFDEITHHKRIESEQIMPFLSFGLAVHF